MRKLLKNTTLNAVLLILLAGCGKSENKTSNISANIKELVPVKYQGMVDVSRMQCEKITRSSYIHRLCYDASEQYIVVLLGNTYYHHCAIPESIVSNWREAESMGRFYRYQIRGNFDCRLSTLPAYAINNTSTVSVLTSTQQSSENAEFVQTILSPNDPNFVLDFTGYAEANNWATASSSRRQELIAILLAKLKEAGANEVYLEKASQFMDRKAYAWGQPVKSKQPLDKLNIDQKRNIPHACEAGHWVDSVSSGGEIVRLEDSSLWEVNSIDQVDSSLWLATDDVVVCDDKLINTDNNDSVEVRKVK